MSLLEEFNDWKIMKGEGDEAIIIPPSPPKDRSPLREAAAPSGSGASGAEKRPPPDLSRVQNPAAAAASSGSGGARHTPKISFASMEALNEEAEEEQEEVKEKNTYEQRRAKLISRSTSGGPRVESPANAKEGAAKADGVKDAAGGSDVADAAKIVDSPLPVSGNLLSETPGGKPKRSALKNFTVAFQTGTKEGEQPKPKVNWAVGKKSFRKLGDDLAALEPRSSIGHAAIDVSGPLGSGAPRAPRKTQATYARQSMIMCMDPMCNKCPPEMHMHMRKAQQSIRLGAPTKAPKAKPKFNFSDWEKDQEQTEAEEEELEEEEEFVNYTLQLGSLKFSFRRRRFLSTLMPSVIHPHSSFVKTWMKVFMCCCILGFFIDPLFYITYSLNSTYYCFFTKWAYLYSLVGIRTFIDTVTLFNMFLQTRLAFSATHRHLKNGVRNMHGELVKLGELVFEEKTIFWNYVNSHFFYDLLSVLPLPQIIFLVIFPDNSDLEPTWAMIVRLLILVQYIPRARRMTIQFSSSGGYGHLLDTPWASFILNLVTFFMASHLIGSMWYLQTVQRLSWCLHNVCYSESNCDLSYLSCPHGVSSSMEGYAGLMSWANTTQAGAICYFQTQGNFPFGIFDLGVQLTGQRSWFDQWLYSLMWGFQQISTLAGNLVSSYLVGEVLFMLLMIVLGLFLFAFLIGNMQNFLQSISRRAMEYRLHLRDIEIWMEQNEIPRDLQKRVRALERYQWVVNQGVNEEEVLSSLSEDIRRDVRRYLALELITKCHLLSVMDSVVQDFICERLKQRLFVDGTVVVKEGHPLNRMFFVQRGMLESVTTNKGQTGFFETVTLSNGDFFGEELLIHFIEKQALLPNMKKRRGSKSLRRARSNRDTFGTKLDVLPKSQRTVRCVGPVDGFSLEAEDIEFICTHFSHVMQSNKVDHALNICSLNRQSHAATTIQVWYRNHLRKKYEIPLNVVQQAVRKKRYGTLLRQVKEVVEGKKEKGSRDLKQKMEDDKPDPDNFTRQDSTGEEVREGASIGRGDLVDVFLKAFRMPKKSLARDLSDTENADRHSNQGSKRSALSKTDSENSAPDADAAPGIPRASSTDKKFEFEW